MIDHLDNLLRKLILMQNIGLTDEAQIRFQPPDEVWRTHVTNLQHIALNVYLVDLRENRKLRSNERVRSIEDGIISEEPPPSLVDCYYLITAWSPAAIGPAVEPTVDEHVLLYRVAAALIRNIPLNPSRIYPPGSAALAAIPESIRDADLPTLVLPAEGFPKLAEFWGTMGINHRWRPAIYLVVTVPITFKKEIAGPIVTTLITEYCQAGSFEDAEVWVQIGGHVLDTSVAPPKAVPNAWVELGTQTGEPLRATETDEDGRFAFDNLHLGKYRLEARAPGRNPLPRTIEVPSPTGEYDLRFH